MLNAVSSCLVTNMNGGFSRTSSKESRTRWTRTELILAAVLLGTIVYILYSTLSAKPPDEEILDCTDPSCYKSLVEITTFIDPSVDPCEDFHGFVCGKFFETGHRRIVPTIDNELEELHNELTSMMTDPPTATDSPSISLLKSFYHSCTDSEAMDADNDTTILNLIQDIGGWPMLHWQRWKEKDFDWIDVMVQCRHLGLPFEWFFEFGTYWEEKNYFRISSPSLVRSSKTADDIRTNMRDITKSLTGRVAGVENVSDFEQSFAKVLMNNTSELSLITVGKLQKEFPTIDWLSFLNSITDGAYEFTEDSEIVTDVLKYTRDLLDLLSKTPKRIQANYIVWKIVQHFAPYMSNRVRRHLVQNLSRSDFCKEETNKMFRYVIKTEYAKKYLSQDLKTSVANLIDLVKSEFLHRLEEVTWLNSTVGEFYSAKFDETTIDIGTQMDVFDDEFMDSNFIHAGNLSFDSTSSVIQMMTERWKLYHDSVFSNINKTGIHPDEKLLLGVITDPDVKFHYHLNRLTVPLPMLRGLTYGPQRSNYLNFGGLGFRLAQGFIAITQHLTANDGNLTNVAFEASNKCFEEDYLRVMSGRPVSFDSSRFVEVLVPDIVGRDIAHGAYQKWVESNGEETKLPVLPYTPNQLFWIKSSLINCLEKLPDNQNRPELLLSEAKNVFSARHSPHFAEDFECPEEAAMNPKHKCY